MKKIVSISLFFLISATIWLACKKEVEEEPFLTIEEKTISFKKEASSKAILIKTNIDGWMVKVPSDANSWLTATKEGQNLKVNVKTNTSGAREAILKVEGKGLVREVKVYQLGDKPEILVDIQNIKIEKITEKIEFTVTTNVEYEIELPNWITHDSKKQLEENKGYKHWFNVAKNTEESPRTATIKVQSKGLSTPIIKRVYVTQSAGYEGSDASSIEGDIKLKIHRGTTSSYQSGGEIDKSFDGDMTTIYHSNWSNGGANYFPITIEYFFETPQDVDYMMYYPRTKGSNGHFKQVEIQVATEANPSYVKLKDFDFKGNGKVTRVEFSPITKAKSFKLIIKSGYGNGQGFAAVAEMEFYKKNTGSFDPTSIFTDITCSELKPNVTDEQIQNISNPFYKSIAQYMKLGQYPSEFRIQNYRAWPNPDVYRERYRMQYSYSNLDNPTGIAVQEGEELVVFVGPTNGRQIQIKIQNLDLPGGDGFGNASYHPLYEGVNKFKTGKGGLIYLQYQTEDYQVAPQIKVHFATGKVNGYFDKTKHNDADWNRLINATTNKYFDVIGEKSHICFPVDSYKAHTGSRGRELIEQFDKLMVQTHKFAGLTKERGKELPNRSYFQVMYNEYHMYCTANRTSYNVTTMSTLCSPDKMGAASDKTKIDVWGPAHEIGHAHQVAPVFMWKGMTECTVNMNSMNIQTAWGIPTRLERESMQGEGGYNNRYEKAYNLGIVLKRAHADIANNNHNKADVFCQLVPFWQLNLYFSKVKDDPEFSVKLYDKIRAVQQKSKIDDGEYQVDFTKTVSDLTQTNLIPFFEKWGFYTPIDKEVDDYGTRRVVVTSNYANDIKQQITGAGYTTLTDRIEYICDTNWMYFKNKASVVKGSASKNGSQITTSGYQNVVAYEVYKANELIFVSNKNSFNIKQNVTNDIVIYAIAYNGERTQVTF
ncbi:M60 family metallopeptidase [Capnocytophaga canimorsus]|uniref:M60 family metallopeptidase n=1 Tax=Capnocytophaga canimorsus TaxID=28188 RepID=UPI0038590DB5